MSDPRLSPIWQLFSGIQRLSFQCVFPLTASGESFPSRFSPTFIALDWWCWQVWVLRFDFPLSFWLAFVQQLEILSILFCGGGLGMFILFLFFFSLKHVRTIYLWQLAFCKSNVFGIHFSGAGCKCCRIWTIEKPSTTLRVGEIGFIMLVRPQELTPPALNPEQRGYKVSIGSAWHQTLVGSADY